MYFTRILATALILAATTGETIIAVNPTKTPATGSEAKPSTSKDSICLRIGDNQGPGLGEIITTQLGSAKEHCQCTIFYLCDHNDAVTADEMGHAIQCPNNNEVCCRAPIRWIPSPHPIILPDSNAGGTQPPPDGGTGQSNCVCVPSHQCTNKQETLAGVGLLNPRFPCVPPDICCAPDSISGGATGYTPTQPPYVNPVTQFPPDVSTITPGECGIRYPSILNRISAPEHSAGTSFGEFPWMAMLLTTETASDGVVTNNVFVCGASIISETIVLTAAHCVHDKVPEALIVRAGEYNTHQGASEPLIHQDRQVDGISLHDDFNPRVLFNDVALVRVSKPFDFASHVNPICSLILNSEFADPSSYNPSSCVATGWGKNAFNIGEYQTTLKRVDLTLVEQNECQNRLRSTRLGQQFILHNSFICAGGREGFDTCEGDGGGPLVCATNENPNKYVQVGIVSWGIGCASDVPSVYASVNATRDWLSVAYNSLSIFRTDTSSRIGTSSKAGSNSKGGSSSKPSSNSART